MKKLFLFLLLFPIFLWGNDPEPTVILTGSDFQGTTHEAAAKVVKEIIEQIKLDGYKTISNVFFCGDYSLNYQSKQSETGLLTLTEVLVNANLKIDRNQIIFVQGNHDPIGTKYLAHSGAHQPQNKKYGIFIINEDDYMWFQGKKTTDGNPNISDDAKKIKQTAENLDLYMKEKLKENFKAPIFILSHLPLHYCMRTYLDGDGNFAKPIFDVLNHYGKLGLNIIFLYGHNHSNGWDNYLGGASVFLKPKEKMNISLFDNHKKCSEETLHFIYANAGYTGYYTTQDNQDQAERNLSMLIFEIYPTHVIIKRYSPQGLCPLKAKGVYNTKNQQLERKLNLYQPNFTIQPSPFRLAL